MLVFIIIIIIIIFCFIRQFEPSPVNEDISYHFIKEDKFMAQCFSTNFLKLPYEFHVELISLHYNLDIKLK